MLIKSLRQTRRASLPLGLLLAGLLIATNSQASFAAQGVIDYVTTQAGHSGFIVDTRKPESCEAASLKGARCLPARDLLGPHKRLANFSGLIWLLGTAGLTGEEHVLVTGDQSTNKEFIAGVLYLAGQRKVSVLTSPLKSLPEGKMAPGISRSKTRENVYQAAMRSDLIVLRSELAGMLQSGNAPVLLDGRSESEYWGQDVRGPRGGHLPGAQHLPATSVLPAKNDPPPVQLGPHPLMIFAVARAAFARAEMCCQSGNVVEIMDFLHGRDEHLIMP